MVLQFWILIEEVQRVDLDSIRAGRHVRGSYVEGEGYIRLHSRLCVSAGGSEKGRKSPERKGCEKIAFHNILLGGSFYSGTRTEFAACVRRCVGYLRAISMFCVSGVAGNLDLPLGFGGRHGHAGVALACPNLSQKVLVATMVENQLLVHVAGSLPLEQGEHGVAGVEIADHDEVGVEIGALDLVGAGRQMRGSYVKSEGHISPRSGLSIGAGVVDQERQRHERYGTDKVAFHNILPGVPRSGTQTEFASQTFSSFTGSSLTHSPIACPRPNANAVRLRGSFPLFAMT